MFDIKNTTIHLTRGDKAVIGLTVEDYIFKVGDHVEFRVYEKNGLDKSPLKTKEVDVEEEQEEVEIILESEDTKIGEYSNTKIKYWYEIELNNENTVIGYDEQGPKELILYPEGVEEND